MSNKPIKDMIEAIEYFAQTQPSFPVYNVLGEERTYGDLKADSDSLAATIDRLGLPEKSPRSRFWLVRSMRCWLPL